MKLHENKQLFTQAVEFTAQQMNLPSIFIEKDYWVTFALKAIFNSKIGNETIFKGGTALSKCFGLIDRFSEDIDLVALRKEGEGSNQMKKKLREIGKAVKDQLPEVKIDNITQKKGMNRKTAHSYSKEFSGDFGQVRDVIILEATWLGYHEPFVSKQISSFIYEMMESTDQLGIAQEYDLLPFDVLVLDPKRTLCEKIMSLVRFSYAEDPIVSLQNKIRHVYDLHQLLRDNDIYSFFTSSDFDVMLLKVANDDVKSFINNNAWLKYHPSESLIFSKLDEVWSDLERTYKGDFRNLVFGDLPDPREVEKTLKEIEERLANVEWNVSVGS